MAEIRKVTESDKNEWFLYDRHLAESEFVHIAALQRGYVILEDHQVIGVCRWNLFWDSIPFLTLLYLREDRRGQAIGRQVMDFWEKEMKASGYHALMTSTQTDETAQHFYRKLGFQDCGCLVLNQIPELEQAMEMFFIKAI